MGKIVAIGGGEIGRQGFPIETLLIDRETMRLSTKKRPKIAFLPTASGDHPQYIQTVNEYFGKRLGCIVIPILLSDKHQAKAERERIILTSDIVYVGGGNTLQMMKIWRATGVDVILQRAYKSNIVLSGVSAGAICWFTYGVSDSWRSSNPNAPYIRVRGLGIIPALYCPHFSLEKERKPALKNMMKRTSLMGLAVDDCSAIEIIDNTYRILSARPNAQAYATYYKHGNYHQTPLKSNTAFLPLHSLLENDK